MSHAPFTDRLPVSPQTPWPTAGGASGEALRIFDWAQTALGPVEHWTPAFRGIVDLILASAFPMVVLWGPELVQIFNDGYGEILGGRRHTAMGQPTRECWPEVWSFNEPVYQKVWQGETLRFENQHFPITRHGFPEDAYFTLCYSPLRQHGDIRGILVTVVETTAQIAAEAHRKEAEFELREMAESMPQLTWTANPEGSVTSCSQRWLDLTGITRAEALGNRWVQLPHPDDLDRMLMDWQHAVSTGEPYDTVIRIRHAAGDYCWMRARAFPYRDPSGQILKWFGTVEDIDERVKTLQALKGSEGRLRLAQEAASIATWDWELSTGAFTWDGETAQIFGRAPEELDHVDRILRFLHPDDVAPTMQAIQPAVEGRADFHFEFRTIWPDGSVHWVEGRGRPLLSSEGKPLRVIGVNQDLTPRKQSEAALLQTEKLAAVGRLASSIAHEINNPLESITNLLYLLGADQDLTPESRNYLEMAEAELRRASYITAQTLRFHRQSSRPAEADIGELLDSVLALYQVRFRSSGVRVGRRYRAPVKLLCREGDIRQVLNNLIGNAFDALRSGGQLLLRARDATDWPSGRRGVRITVADSGEGMTPETQKRLFDAFYTTKGSNGNGLGLWISKGIIDHHEGRIRLKSGRREGRHGTVFSLFLPQMPPASRPSASPESAAVP